MNKLILKQIFSVLIVALLFSCSTVLYAQGYTVKTIVIDAGHGGKDPGASGKYSKEKDIALKVALLTGNYIQQNLKDVDVVYTRKSDVFIPLPERAQIAHKAKADLFISIHVDAVGKSTVRGASTYVLGQHRSDDNLRVAQKENAVIMLEDNYEEKYSGFDPTNPASYIIFNFVTGAYLQQSTNLADNIQNEFKTREGRYDRGVHQAGFLVLRETSMPSVLVELGFITNSEEERFLNTKQGQEYMASAIYRAVRNYKTNIDGRNHVGLENNTTNEIAKQTSSSKASPAQTSNESTVTAVNRSSNNTEELIFKLQIMASRKALDTKSKQFKGLSDVDYYKENDYFKYTVGHTTSASAIKKLKQDVKNQFPDAFIIAFKNGEKLSFSQVNQLLK